MTVLDPQGRQHLFEALRPPDGYRLDFAIGTSFSLDLTALLAVPLAFTFFGAGEIKSRPDPLALLDGVRRYADRIAVFCQAGQIAVPKKEQLLYGYLEPIVVEVTPRSRHGVFHPKVWALRFIPDASDEQSQGRQDVVYRLLCMSRNLTFDRSWDTILVLDGKLIERKNAFAENHPLGDFFKALPGLSIRSVPTRISERVDQIQYELRRVRFNKPWPFESIKFCPMGIKRGTTWPYGGSKRSLLVISPFLTSGFLARITRDCRSNSLISRIDGPNGLESFSADQLSAFDKIYVLSQNANPEEEDVDDDVEVDRTTSAFNPPLSGLHAKVYIAEQWGNDQRVHLWTGSANATDAAVKHNVEFLVRLVGRKRDLGIEKLLTDKEDEIDLRDLLEEYDPPADANPPDNAELKLDRRLRDFQRLVFNTLFAAEVLPLPDEDRFRIRLTWSGDQLYRILSNAKLRCWPITVPSDNATDIVDIELAQVTIGPVSIEAVTSFFAFEIETKVGARSGKRRFVLNVPLINPPEKRRERILRRLLRDRQSVLRYLLFLLAEGGDIYAAGTGAIRLLVDRDVDGGGSDLELPVHLFESFTQALARHPEKLDQIDRLYRELLETDSISLLPDGFEDIWKPVWEAREGLRMNQHQAESGADGETENND